VLKNEPTVTMEDQWEIISGLLNGTNTNDVEGHSFNSHTSGNIACINYKCLHMNCKAHMLVISTVLSKQKDFSRCHAVMYMVKVQDRNMVTTDADMK